MNKLVAIVVGVVVVGGGAGLYLATKDDSSSSSDMGNSSKTAVSDASAFNPASTLGLSFEATISTVSDGKTIKSVMESDAKTGAVRYSADANDGSFSMIYTKDAYYMCQDSGDCFKYKLGQGQGASFDPKNYQYDDSKIADYRTNSKKVGTEDCSTGKCDVWQVSSADGAVAKIFIDTKTQRVVQVVSEANGVNSTITYDYKDISVDIPKNAKELPGINSLQP